MVSETFINLSDEKKQKIEGALLKEFSTYPLAKAQVARIVKDAGIARGAFYKYFGDLKDSLTMPSLLVTLCHFRCVLSLFLK